MTLKYHLGRIVFFCLLSSCLVVTCFVNIDTQGHTQTLPHILIHTHEQTLARVWASCVHGSPAKKWLDHEIE